jgi:glucose-6-phosphate-specific signal transduction histidine kinase
LYRIAAPEGRGAGRRRQQREHRQAQLSAYRIVQGRSATRCATRPGRATVEVDYQPDRLLLRVRNDAPAAGRDTSGPASPGQGIIGMRERAAMLGGELVAEPTPEGGYLVEATLPLGERRQVEPP